MGLFVVVVIDGFSLCIVFILGVIWMSKIIDIFHNVWWYIESGAAESATPTNQCVITRDSRLYDEVWGYLLLILALLAISVNKIIDCSGKSYHNVVLLMFLQ